MHFKKYQLISYDMLKVADVEVKNAEVDENKDTTYVMSLLEVECKSTKLVIKHLRWKNW